MFQQKTQNNFRLLFNFQHHSHKAFILCKPILLHAYVAPKSI